MKLGAVLSLIFLVMGFSLKPIDEYIYCEIYSGSGTVQIDNSIKFSEEGVLCKNTSIKKGRKILFIEYSKLNRENLKSLQELLLRNNFFDYDSSYVCKSQKIGLPVNRTIVIKYQNKIKQIQYNECYKPELDSVFFYVNKLLPDNKKEFLVDVTNKQSCNCEQN